MRNAWKILLGLSVLVPRTLRSPNPGLKKTLGSSGTLKDVDTAVVAGVRMYIRF